jgi:UDP-N-acetylglucosamine--N-acetylmuramyl-(pentapeptide) pyrophosphoryl-undecaprenol N-acetylglucosamine transferase
MITAVAKSFDHETVSAREAEDKSPSPLIVFAGGGTGGHLYPALAVAEALRQKIPRVRFLFFGTQRPIDKQILGSQRKNQSQDDFSLVQQSLPALARAPWRWPAIYQGFRSSTRLCRERFEVHRPVVVIGTGGLGSVPAVREASRMGIHTALLNPDALPGRANRYLARISNSVFVQWDEASAQFPSPVNVMVTGCPVRSSFNVATREDGLARFGLSQSRKTLLITGASQGARTVNEAVVANLDFLAGLSGWQVLHLTGHSEFEEVKAAYARLGSKMDGRATVLAYTDHLSDALSAADLVVARAGASSLAEITAMGRASILMPYPHHKDLHQLANARCLVRSSAARIVHDKIDARINGPALRLVLEQLINDDEGRGAMAAAAKRLGRGQAAAQIADYVVELPEVQALQHRNTEQLNPAHADPN